MIEYEDSTGLDAIRTGGENQPIVDDAGEIIGYQGSDHDITARRESEEAFRFTVSPVFNAEKQLTHFDGIQNDITDRIRSEQQVQQYARQQTTIARLGQLAISNSDLDALMTNVVRGVADTLDVEYCEVLECLAGGEQAILRAGVGWKDGLIGYATIGTDLESQAGYALASDAPVIVKDLRRERRFSGPPLLHDHSVVSGISMTVRGCDGPFGVLGAHTTKQRKFDQDEINFLQAVANLLADAIQRKQTEDALRASEAQFRNLLDQHVDAVGLAVDGKIIYGNEQMCNLIGLPLADYIGRSADEFLAPEDGERATEQIESLFAGENPTAVEYQVVRKDGSTIPCEAFFHLIEYDGSPAVLIVMRDIADRKEMEKQLRRADRLASIGTLAAGIAHEINNPLSAAWTAADTALKLKNNSSSDLFEEALDAVVDSVKRCNRIIQNVLRFSRNQASSKSPHDVNQIILRACEMSRSYARKNGVNLVLELGENLPHPTINAIEFEQVLVNLVGNAIEASERSTDVTVSSVAAGKTIYFTVNDKGKGMSDDEQAKIFDPFYTRRADERGVGLGLSIVYRIIQEHGGSIDITSGIGKGTSMKVGLPVAVA